MGLSGGEECHLSVFLSGFHASVYHHDAIVREGFGNDFEALFECEQVEFLVFLNERVYDVALPSLTQLAADEPIYLFAAVVVA